MKLYDDYKPRTTIFGVRGNYTFVPERKQNEAIFRGDSIWDNKTSLVPVPVPVDRSIVVGNSWAEFTTPADGTTVITNGFPVDPQIPLQAQFPPLSDADLIYNLLSRIRELEKQMLELKTQSDTAWYLDVSETEEDEVKPKRKFRLIEEKVQ